LDSHRLTALLGDLELHGPLSLLLHDDGPTGHAFPMRDISDTQLHEITGSELTIDGEVEHGELSDPPRELQTDADRPDVLEA